MTNEGKGEDLEGKKNINKDGGEKETARGAKEKGQPSKAASCMCSWCTQPNKTQGWLSLQV